MKPKKIFKHIRIAKRDIEMNNLQNINAHNQRETIARTKKV